MENNLSVSIDDLPARAVLAAGSWSESTSWIFQQCSHFVTLKGVKQDYTLGRYIRMDSATHTLRLNLQCLANGSLGFIFAFLSFFGVVQPRLWVSLLLFTLHVSVSEAKKKKPFSKSVTFQLGLCEFMLNPKVRIWFYYWNVSPYVIWKCSGLLGEFLFSLSFSFSIITIRGTGNSPTFNPGSLSAMINGSSAQCSLRCRFQHCSLDT